MKVPNWKRRETTQDSDTKAERRAKHYYQVLLIVSLFGNGALALWQQWTAEARDAISEEKTRIESRKATLEAEYAALKLKPTIVVSQISYDIRTFLELTKSNNSVLPFLHKVKDLRIIENDTMKQIGSDRPQKPRRLALVAVTFLVVANVGEINAHELQLKSPATGPTPVGDLLAASAILIPLSYQLSSGAVVSPTIRPTELLYSIRTANGTDQMTQAVPPVVAQAWTPASGKLRGIARANQGDSNDHVSSALREKK